MKALVEGRVVGTLALAALALSCVRQGARDTTPEATVSSPRAGGNLIKNADFEDGGTLPWTSSFSHPAKGRLTVKDGAACLTIETAGANKWDAQIRHREMVVKNGHHYAVAFTIWADQPTRASIKVGMSGPPYGEYYNDLVDVTTTPQVVSGGFVMKAPDDATAEFAFHLGGPLLKGTVLPATICIDDVRLTDPEFTAPPREAKRAIPAVRVNELGYFPSASKLAVFATAIQAPQAWALRAGEMVVATGETTPLGEDLDSGERLQLIDFSRVTEPGSGYVLEVGEQGSYPFDIGAGLYHSLKHAALKYFYHNRSGVAIEMPYAEQERWTRPAGHARSDKSVPCAKDAGCDYALDVSKGWYDAGDHGKYVVNGGISVWTLMNLYERFSAHGDASAFGDGTLNIPESKNGVPDLLDEARWEMEFMLGMQVPEGKPKAGMVHHKMHDTQWTALGLAPHEAEGAQARHLRPVSTAATLNLAATAAQAARLFRKFDEAFATRCLRAAERAWTAAKAEPALLAPASDGDRGGGPYNDDQVEDDFFWAAAELFITTKKPAYGKAMRAARYFRELSPETGGLPTVMTWSRTDGLGTLSLSVVPGALEGAELKAQRALVIAAADRFVATAMEQGYRVPFSGGAEHQYPWGSNSYVINNSMILAYAHDFTQKDEYLEATIWGMDYLLGRNALAQSYVTGFGENPLLNPHHRFWARQANAQYPEAPPGALSGGPNSSLQDPYAQAAGLPGCAPQQCFVDHIEAWSVNEITINWNAPFAWVAAYLDEYGPQARGASAP